jgi:hypothetical protein
MMAIPTMQMGHIARVDSYYGNDSTGTLGGLPFASVQAALNVCSYGDSVWVLPGTYNLTAGIVMATGISMRGFSVQTTTIQMLGVTANTTLLTMSSNSRIEDLTLKLTSAGHYTLKGIVFGGTTTADAKLRTCVLTVDNSAASASGTSNVYGIECNGTGTLGSGSFSYNSLKGSTVNVYSNGGGNKRGVLVSTANVVSTRDLNIYVAQPSNTTTSTGSYVGVETADPSNVGSIQMRSTTVGTVTPTVGQTYTASDILQTNPSTISNPTYLASAGIQIGPGVDLVTKTAGGAPFSTYNYPTTLFYGCRDVISNTKSGYLWPGTVLFSNSTPKYPAAGGASAVAVAHYRVQQPLIVCGLSVYCGTAPGGATNVTVTVCKNAATGASLSNATSVTVTITGTATSANYYDTSVNFDSGDYLNMYFTTNSGALADVAVQVDCF